VGRLALQVVGQHFSTTFTVDDEERFSLNLTAPVNVSSGLPLRCPPLPRNHTALSLPAETKSRRLAPALPPASIDNSLVDCLFVHGLRDWNMRYTGFVFRLLS